MNKLLNHNPEQIIHNGFFFMRFFVFAQNKGRPILDALCFVLNDR